MNKFTLTFVGLMVFFAACHKDDAEVTAQGCYSCTVKLTYTGAAGSYVPPPDTFIQEVCGTADRDTLLKRNGTSDYGPGGFTSKVTQTISCTAL